MNEGDDVSQWPILCKFKCYTYQLTKQVQIGKKEKKGKKSMRVFINVYILKCGCYPNHSVVKYLEMYCLIWYLIATLNLNAIKIK